MQGFFKAIKSEMYESGEESLRFTPSLFSVGYDQGCHFAGLRFTSGGKAQRPSPKSEHY